jgi:transposase
MVSQSDADTSSHTTGHMSSSKARVQIVGRVSGRRTWTVEQKLAIIGEAFTSGSSVANTIERHEISSGQLYTWRRQLLDGELAGVRNGNLDHQNGLGFARVELAPPCETPALPPALTGSSSPSSPPGACERSDDRRGAIEIEIRSGVRVRVSKPTWLGDECPKALKYRHVG